MHSKTFGSFSLSPSISSPSLVVYSIHKIVFRFFFFFFFFVPRGVDNRFSPYMASRIIFPLSVVDLWIATVADAIALRSGRRWVGGWGAIVFLVLSAASLSDFISDSFPSSAERKMRSSLGSHHPKWRKFINNYSVLFSYRSRRKTADALLQVEPQLNSSITNERRASGPPSS